MSGGDAERDEAAAASRLEQALERIARAARPAPPPAPQPVNHEPAGIDRPRIAARLDTVISDLRAALDP